MTILLSTIITNLAIASAVLASPLASPASSVSCKPYIPFGANSPQGKLNFYNENPTHSPSAQNPGLDAPTLPSNATTTPSGLLYLSNHNTSTGTTFTLQTCNVSSPSLNLTSPRSDAPGGCRYNYCDITYDNFIRIINPKTGHCLTSKGYKQQQYTTFGFQDCEGRPNGTEQFFDARQVVRVTTAGNGGKSYGYGVVGVNNAEYVNEYGPFLAWDLEERDNRTVLWDAESKYGGSDGMGVQLVSV